MRGAGLQRRGRRRAARRRREHASSSPSASCPTRSGARTTQAASRSASCGGSRSRRRPTRRSSRDTATSRSGKSRSCRRPGARAFAWSHRNNAFLCTRRRGTWTITLSASHVSSEFEAWTAIPRLAWAGRCGPSASEETVGNEQVDRGVQSRAQNRCRQNPFHDDPPKPSCNDQSPGIESGSATRRSSQPCRRASAVRQPHWLCSAKTGYTPMGM